MTIWGIVFKSDSNDKMSSKKFLSNFTRLAGGNSLDGHRPLKIPKLLGEPMGCSRERLAGRGTLGNWKLKKEMIEQYWRWFMWIIHYRKCLVNMKRFYIQCRGQEMLHFLRSVSKQIKCFQLENVEYISFWLHSQMS